MRDRYGRTIDYLRLSVTEACTFRCPYCRPSGGTPPLDDPLSVEELVGIAAAAVRLGVRKIRLTGGEPLERREILEICRRLRALPGLGELCMTTNGARLRGLARPLREAGLDRINVSLDALRPDRFRALTGTGDLGEVLAGIEAAETAGFRRMKLDTVLIGGVNDDEIGDLAALTVERPWEVRFIELMPIGPCASWGRERSIPAGTVLERCPDLREIEPEGVARRYAFPGAAGTVGLIAPLSGSFCASCRRIRVTADGHLKGCLHGREEIPLKGLRGAELEAAILRGIAGRPARHHLDEGRSGSARTMDRIGG